MTGQPFPQNGLTQQLLPEDFDKENPLHEFFGDHLPMEFAEAHEGPEDFFTQNDGEPLDFEGSIDNFFPEDFRY